MRLTRTGSRLLAPVLLAIALLVPAPPATAEEGSKSATDSWPPGGVPIFELPDTIMVEARRYGYGTRQVELLYDTLRPSLADSLRLPASPFALRPRTMELSRFGCAMYGADLGAATALNLGGLGSLLGWWSEETAFYMMGAGAALGAIWGGTLGNENSKFRIRIDARPDEH